MRFHILPGLLLLTAACGTSTGNDDTGNGEDTEEETDYLEVVALGFEYVGGWDEEFGLLENYVYRDSNGDPQASGNFVRVTLASLDYFSMSSDESGFEEEYCEFIAGF